MRRSLLVRLLVVSLAIAAAAIAATTWLTTRNTTNQIENQAARTLEVDNVIHERLVDYAWTHEGWDGVDGLVRRLADQHGRRIVLTTPDGKLIVDSDELLGNDAAPRSRVAAALVDPFTAEDSQVGWNVDVAFPETTYTASAGRPGTETIVELDALSRPMPSAFDDQAIVYSSGVAGIGDIAIPPAVYRFTDDEVDGRHQAALDTARCARKLGVDARVIGLDRRNPTVEFNTPPGKMRKSAEVQCMPPSSILNQRSERYLAVMRQMKEAVVACRDEQRRANAEVDSAVTADEARAAAGAGASGGDGTKVLELKPTSDVLNGVVMEEVSTTSFCETRAARQVLRDYVTKPALLYLGSGEPERGALATFGRSDTIVALVAVFALALLATVLVGHRILRPVHSITAAAERMASGDRTARVEAAGRDELARLAATFNSMADSVERTERQHKTMVSDVAHELRNPLANVRGHLEAAQDDVIPTDDRLVASLLEETTVLQHLVDDLQDLALAEAGRMTIHPELVDVRQIAAQSIDAQRAHATVAGVTMTVEGDEHSPILADPKRLRQMVGNLVANALRYTQEGGTVAVRINDPAGAQVDGGSDWVTIAVADTGVGIEPTHLPHLFDRFYRADDSRSRETGGTGLGLAIVRHLVEAHGGHVTVASKIGAGSVFTLFLPATRTG